MGLSAALAGDAEGGLCGEGCRSSLILGEGLGVGEWDVTGWMGDEDSLECGGRVGGGAVVVFTGTFAGFFPTGSSYNSMDCSDKLLAGRSCALRTQGNATPSSRQKT